MSGAASVEEDTTQWMNQCVRYLWPYVAQFARLTVHETLEPMARAAMPRMFRSFRLTEVDFSSCEPAEVRNMWVVRTHVGEPVIRLRFDIRLDGKPNVRMRVPPFSEFHVSHLTIEGRMGVVFRPLFSEPPFVGAFQAFFANPPKVVLQLGGVGKVTQLPVIRRVLESTMDAAIAEMFVLPNSYALKLTEKDGLFQQLFVYPIGIVRVRILEARNLRDSDLQGLSGTFNFLAQEQQ